MALRSKDSGEIGTENHTPTAPRGPSFGPESLPDVISGVDPPGVDRRDLRFDEVYRELGIDPEQVKRRGDHF